MTKSQANQHHPVTNNPETHLLCLQRPTEEGEMDVYQLLHITASAVQSAPYHPEQLHITGLRSSVLFLPSCHFTILFTSLCRKYSGGRGRCPVIRTARDHVSKDKMFMSKYEKFMFPLLFKE